VVVGERGEGFSDGARVEGTCRESAVYVGGDCPVLPSARSFGPSSTETSKRLAERLLGRRLALLKFGTSRNRY